MTYIYRRPHSSPQTEQHSDWLPPEPAFTSLHPREDVVEHVHTRLITAEFNTLPIRPLFVPLSTLGERVLECDFYSL